MANLNNPDKTHASEDKAAIERYSQNSLEGWVDTPYVKVLFSEYYAHISQICAVDFGNEMMSYDNKIRAIYAALEMKILNMRGSNMAQIPNQSKKGTQRELNAIGNFRSAILRTIEEKQRVITNWRLKSVAIMNQYNNRIAAYIDDVLGIKTVVVDYPKLDESDIPSVFDDELTLANRQRERYEERIDKLMREIPESILGTS